MVAAARDLACATVLFLDSYDPLDVSTPAQAECLRYL
jgi:hypothetical protein